MNNYILGGILLLITTFSSLYFVKCSHKDSNNDVTIESREDVKINVPDNEVMGVGND